MKPLLLLARQDLRAIRWWLLLALVAGVMVQTHSELWNPLNPFESWTLPVSYVVCGLAWFFMAGTIAFQHPAADPRAAWRLRPVAPWMVVVEKVLLGILVLGGFPALLGVIGSVAQHSDFGDFVRGLPSMARVMGGVFAFATIAYLCFLGLASLCRSSGLFLAVVAGVYLVGSSLLGTIVVGFPELSFSFDPSIRWLAWILFLAGMVSTTVWQYARPNLWRSLSLGFVGAVLLFGLAQVFPGARGTRFLSLDHASASVQLGRSSKSEPAPFSVHVSGLSATDVWELKVKGNSTRSVVTRSDGTTGANGTSNVFVETPALYTALGLEGFRLEGVLVNDARVWTYRPDARLSDPQAAVENDELGSQLVVVSAEVGPAGEAPRNSEPPPLRATVYRNALQPGRAVPLKAGAFAVGKLGKVEVVDVLKEGRRLRVTIRMDRMRGKRGEPVPAILVAWVDTAARRAHLAQAGSPAKLSTLGDTDQIELHLSLVLPDGATEPDELRVYDRRWTGFALLPTQVTSH